MYYSNRTQTRTKDYYNKRNEFKKLVIAVKQKQERIVKEQKLETS